MFMGKVQCNVENEAGGRVYQNNANDMLAPPANSQQPLAFQPSSPPTLQPPPKLCAIRHQPASARDRQKRQKL